MTDPRKVIGILQDARELVRTDWWDGGVIHGERLGAGGHCAITSFGGFMSDPCYEASLEALATVMGLEDWQLIPSFNDSHTHAEVLAAFDKAIANLEGELVEPVPTEPTPNADALIAINAAGDAVARAIVADHPNMPLSEVEPLVRTELFYAAQDAAEALALGIVTERS